MGRLIDISTAFNAFYNGITKAFLDGFIPRQENDQIPPESFPYLTYTIADLDHSQSFLQTVRIFTKSSSFKEVLRLSEKLEDIIVNGTRLNLPNGGYAHLSKGNPFVQIVPDENPNIKSALVNVEVKIYK